MGSAASDEQSVRRTRVARLLALLVATAALLAWSPMQAAVLRNFAMRIVVRAAASEEPAVAESAVPYLRQSLALDPSATRSGADVARVYQLLHSAAAALDVADRYDIIATDPVAAVVVGHGYMEHGRTDAAIQAWRTGGVARHVAGAYVAAGAAAREARAFEVALRDLDVAIRVEPLTVDAHFARAETLRMSGAPPDELRRAYQQVISVDPRFYWAYLRLADVEFAAGACDRADQWLREVRPFVPQALQPASQPRTCGNADR
jgi:tetratricopeptide (TPR) repeat protein